MANGFRLPAGADDLGDVVDADRPSLDEALHVTLCDDALAGLDPRIRSKKMKIANYTTARSLYPWLET